MENHPIPQDVTGFQFKLIGNMTVKQFAYLAVGTVLAVVFYYAPLPFLIKFPLIIVCAGLGAALAFLPFEGRPLDVMMQYFIKALFSPNQYMFVKTGHELNLYLPPIKQVTGAKTTTTDTARLAKQQQLAKVLSSSSAKRTALDEKENAFLSHLFNATTAPLLQVQTVPTMTPTMPSAPPPPQTQPVDTGESVIEKQLADAKTLEASVVSQSASAPTPQNQAMVQQAHQRVTEMETQLKEYIAQKERLEQEMKELKQQLASGQQKVYVPTAAPVEKQETLNVRAVPKAQSASIGLLNVPDFPNLIAGIVKDPRGNVLPNILVEVKDKDGNAVRAFKTNALGQFISATQLMNGTYTIEFDDPKQQHKFDTIEVSASGSIMQPLEVISHDAREELRKALFN